MKDVADLKRRYEQDSSAVQLGGLASNLARIAWHAQRNDKPGSSLFRESKYFAEWAAPGCSPEGQALLAQVQLLLALWEPRWGKALDPARIAQEAEQCSERLLTSAGLIGSRVL